MLAADREDETVAASYKPAHPAVLRLIQSTVEAAEAASRPVTICGDMAGDPFYTELLVGLGLREISVAPGEMLEVKARIRDIDTVIARQLARRALELGSATEVEALLGRGEPERPSIAMAEPSESRGSPPD